MKEFDFIKDIKKNFRNDWENEIGNDSALFNLQGEQGLVTKDLLVEGVHFYPNIPLDALAYKALAVNISDIISDGGSPICFIIGVGAPKNRSKEVSKLYEHFAFYTKKLGIPIIGGDTVSSKEFFLSVSCIGKTSTNVWLRKNAEEGDFIYVTGELGSSALGFENIQTLGHDLKNIHIKRHLFPPCYLTLPIHLKNFSIHAAVDISDGLLKDLYRILQESQLGADIFFDRLPFNKELESKEDLILWGGEDYEILFTSKNEINTEEFYQKSQIKITKIGTITNKKSKIHLFYNEKSLIIKDKLIEKKGFRHWF